jgi:hypothetical protein
MEALSKTGSYLSPSIPVDSDSSLRINIVDSSRHNPSASLMAGLRGNMITGGMLDALAKELQILHNSIYSLEKRLQMIEIGLRSPYGQMADNLYGIGPVKDGNTLPEVQGSPKKEEPHPAQNSSFILKI